MEQQISYREYLSGATTVPIKKNKRRGVFAKQVLVSMIIGAAIWGLIGMKSEKALSVISNNVKFNIEYSQILEGMNNIWYTLTINEKD